jgi:hypothetical protein
VGRHVWVVSPALERQDADDPRVTWTIPEYVYDFRVMSFKKFLPRGPIMSDGIIVNMRDRSLVQVTTDPGGLRTVAVAEIYFRDPR